MINGSSPPFHAYATLKLSGQFYQTRPREGGKTKAIVPSAMHSMLLLASVRRTS